MRDNRFAAHVRILLPFAAEIASKFDPIETRTELANLLASDDFKRVGNSEAQHLTELEHFRGLKNPISDADILRMGAFLASDAIETMEYGGIDRGPGSESDKAGLASEAFDQLVERACIHMIMHPGGARAVIKHRKWWMLSFIPHVGDSDSFSIFPDEASARAAMAEMEHPGCWEVYELEEGLTRADIPAGRYL